MRQELAKNKKCETAVSSLITKTYLSMMAY